MYRDYKNKINKKIISEALSVYFENANFAYEKIEAGYENASFYIVLNGHKYVLRIYNAFQYGVHPRDEGNILTELDFIEFCGEKNIPVPKIHKTVNGNFYTKVLINGTAHFAILTDFIEGNQVKKLSLKQVENIAEIQAKMHLTAIEYGTKKIRRVAGPFGVHKWIKSELKKYKPSENKKDLIKHAIDVIDFLGTKINPSTIKKYPPILIHGDLHCENLKFIGDKISGVFDFDDVKKSIAADDIGSFLMEILKTGDSKQLREKAITYFDRYKKIRPISNDEIELSIYFAARRRLVFKLLEFMGIWEDRKTDTIQNFRKVLEQVRRIIDLAKSI